MDLHQKLKIQSYIKNPNPNIKSHYRFNIGTMSYTYTLEDNNWKLRVTRESRVSQSGHEIMHHLMLIDNDKGEYIFENDTSFARQVFAQIHRTQGIHR